MTSFLGSGTIALHGGAEFLPGDEAFLDAIVDRADTSRSSRARPGSSTDGAALGIAIVPTAAAGQHPELAVATGRAAFDRSARRLHVRVVVTGVAVLDARSAEDPGFAESLRRADLIYLPGGDPGIIPHVLPGSAAWRAMLAALADGAVLAGASAGAMACATWTWTPHGGVPGLALVRGLVVLPHFRGDRAGMNTSPGSPPEGLGRLGLPEKTGIISESVGLPAGGAPGAAAVQSGSRWRVVGRGVVHWAAPGSPPLIARPGEILILPGVDA